MKWFALIALIATLAPTGPKTTPPGVYTFTGTLDFSHVADNAKQPTAKRFTSYAVACAVGDISPVAMEHAIATAVHTQPYSAPGIAATQFLPLPNTAQSYTVNVSPPANAATYAPTMWRCTAMFLTADNRVTSYLVPAEWEQAQNYRYGRLPKR